MRPRALALLVAITAADYVLWHWSVATNHDVLSLAAGLTLPPLGTVSLGALGVSCLRLLAGALRATPRARSDRPGELATGSSASRQPTAGQASQEEDPRQRLAA